MRRKKIDNPDRYIDMDIHACIMCIKRKKIYIVYKNKRGESKEMMVLANVI